KKRRGFVWFDLSSSGVSGTVSDATFRLFLKKAPGASHNNEVRRVTATWTEAAITWINQPTVAASPTDTQASGTADNVNIRWSVTSDVQGFVNGSLVNRGWRINDASEATPVNGESQFLSTESGATLKNQWPVLLV